MSKLSKAEREWLEKLQEHLNSCPSKRLGFYTIGDPSISVYDMAKQSKINDLMDSSLRMDFCTAVEKTKAELAELKFPSPVHSTAG